MILLCGIPTESPIEMVRDELDAMNAPYVMFNQRRFDEMHLDFEISSDGARGNLQIGKQFFNLNEFTGIYSRCMDDTQLPELAAEAPDSHRRRRCRALHDALMRWGDLAPTRVVNRVSAMGSNASKPFQAQLISKAGFLVPETLVTNEPELVRQFAKDMGRIIYKSISGARSIVQTFQESDEERLNLIRWCPVQFQQYIEGDDVRVHTVGGRVFATIAKSSATDYRYAVQQTGDAAQLEAIDLSDELSEMCVSLSRSLGLDFSGIDLKITPSGEVYCFEVNPCPGYSYYEANTGQPIARAVASYLTGYAN